MSAIGELADYELREEWLWNLLYRNRIFALAAVGLIIFAVACWQLHAYNQELKLRNYVNLYQSAQELLANGKSDAARAKFAKLAADGSSGVYGVLAKLREATIVAERVPPAGMDAYAEIAQSTKTILRDFARLRAGYLAIETGDMQITKDLVGDLIGDSNPLNHSAREILLLMSIKHRDWGIAVTQASEILASLETPQGLARRVKMLASFSEGRYTTD